jgi:hypothetical protein
MTFPWMIYGTTNVPGGGIAGVLFNPTPSVNGVPGEITVLPYKVPATNQLQLLQWGVTVPDVGGTAGMFPVIGGATTAVQKRLPAAMAIAGMGLIQVTFTLPAGSVLTFGLINNMGESSLLSWYAIGNLV